MKMGKLAINRGMEVIIFILNTDVNEADRQLLQITTVKMFRTDEL